MIKKIVTLSVIVTMAFSCSTPADKTAVNINPKDSITITNDPIKAATVAIETISPDQLITPGKSIGHIALGENQAAAVAQLGKPDFGDAAMGSSLVTWYAGHDSTQYQTSIFSQKNFGGKDETIALIKKILVTSPWFKTAEKLGVGNTHSDIGKVYTLQLTQANTQGKDSINVFTDLRKGISFEIDKTNKCVGVIVHQPNEESGTYLDMHQK